MNDTRATSGVSPLRGLNAEPAVSGIPDEIRAQMMDLGRRARLAAHQLGLASADQKNAALAAMAASIRARAPQILQANVQDVAQARDNGLAVSFVDRLSLDESRVQDIALAIDSVAGLPDPVGRVLARFERPNGLVIERVATPLGVIGVIFESRPNVTADAGALCLKAGNAAILRAGSDSFRTSSVIAAAMGQGLKEAGLPADAICLVPTRDRAAVGAMLSGLGGNIDVIVPRGGKSLVARVQEEARVPVFAHLEGLCHVYVDKAADLRMAKDIVLNAKMRRTGVCGSAETLLVDRACVGTHLKPLIETLIAGGCAVRGDAEALAVNSRVTPAVEEDWRTEYLDAIIAVRVVEGLEGAMDHIETYGSHHTDCIVTEDANAASRFLAEVDSAIVLHNASTQFADGGEFGFGAEIGIATGRMHARGPVGRGTAHLVQVQGPRFGPDPPVISGPGAFRIEPSGLTRLPRASRGMRIGLYGGSFNPAHEGHLLVSLLALKRLALDRVWWIVTPGNPLKSTGELASLEERIAQAEAVSAHPRIDVTGFEEAIEARFTVDTLKFLKRRNPGVDFVWIMGADNLASFHRWKGWGQIARMMPIAVIDRPGWTLKATHSRAASAMASGRVEEREATSLASLRPPAWTFLHGPRSHASSTELRRLRRTSSPRAR